MALFCAAINKDSVTLFKFTPCNNVQDISCAIYFV